jgi:hypothetical protein
VDCEFDSEFRYKNPEQLADNIVNKYREVITQDNFLNEIANNAREWYLRNITSPNITNIILNALEL